MSLKKQIKDLKQDVLKNVEQVEKWKRNAKVTKFVEMEAEIELYKNELNRMRHILKHNNEGDDA